MKPASVDRMIWVLIFGGMLLGGFGLSLRGSSAEWGWALVAVGALLVVAGAVLIGVRSRMPDR